MRAERFPPHSLDPVEIVILRRPHAARVVFHYRNGDSYQLTPDDARTYLETLKCEFPDSVIDLAWNFYAVHYVVETQESLIVPHRTAKELFSSDQRLRSLPPRVGTGPDRPQGRVDFWNRMKRLIG